MPPPASPRINEIAASIQGAQLTKDTTRWSQPLTIADVEVSDETILVSLLAGPTILDIIELANDTLNIDVALPRAYEEEFGGMVHDIPTSNITEVAPHVLKSCQ